MEPVRPIDLAVVKIENICEDNSSNEPVTDDASITKETTKKGDAQQVLRKKKPDTAARTEEGAPDANFVKVEVFAAGSAPELEEESSAHNQSSDFRIPIANNGQSDRNQSPAVRFKNFPMTAITPDLAVTEKLIELVRERTLLFDYGNEDYKNRDKKKEAWNEVTAEMGFGESKLWMAKWKSLRDNYNKFRKYNDDAFPSQAYKKYKSWPWAAHMSFLDYLYGRKFDNVPLEYHNATSNSFIDTDNSSVHDSETTTYEIPEDLPNPQIRKKRMKTTVILDDDFSKQNERKIQKSKMDGVDHLFLSYAQTFRTFSRRTQSIVKLEMANLFARYELQLEGGEDARSLFAPPLANQSSCCSTPSSVPSPASSSWPVYEETEERHGETMSTLDD